MTELVGVDFEAPTVVVRPMLTPDRAIDDFLGDCRARGWSERSITSYAATLYRFADRLPADLDVAKITVEDLRRYRASRQRKLSRNTVAGEEAHLSSWLDWLFVNRKIAANPLLRLERTRRTAPEDLEVTTIEPADVRQLLETAKPGPELNAVAILAYLGPRRNAVATLRLADYDRRAGTIRFREKGAKPIRKPVPDELAAILDASISRGEIREAPHDYLVPPEGYLQRPGDRDDRVIWRLVRRVADRARVDAHVHALRAAFACFYLEQYPDDLLGLKELLGHRSLNTTLVYLRRLNRQARMERVRSLSWLGESHPTAFVASPVMGAGGFEPPLPILAAPQTALLPTSPRKEQAPPFEIVVLPAGEARELAARERVAERGITSEIGWRLSGLADGEGHFAIAQMAKGNWRCAFSIKLRADDRPLLDELCLTVGLGSVRTEAPPSRHHPCARWEVSRKEECDVLADVFTVYPLRSKKARDAAIWMAALDEWALVYRNERADWSRLAQLAKEIREVRKFNLTRDDLALLTPDSRPLPGEAAQAPKGTVT